MLSNKKNYETSLTIIGSKGNLKLMGKDLSKIEYVGAKRKLTSKIKQKKQLKIKSNHKELYKNIILSLRGKPNNSINGTVAIDSIKIIIISPSLLFCKFLVNFSISPGPLEKV